jgi:drug/metabolite transporter (DMT)-like permease
LANLLLTIICTTAIGVAVKVAETRIASRMAMLLGNYITAASLSFIIWFASSAATAAGDAPAIPFSLSRAAWVMAPIGGFIFAFNFFLMIVAIKKRGVALPVTLMRLSAIVPISASMLLFAERPAVIQIAGMIGALAAAVMMSLGVEGGEEAAAPVKTSAFFLAVMSLGLLLCFGLADLIMKLFERLGYPGEKPLFLAVLFGFAALFVAMVMALKLTRPELSDLGWGVVLGVPNLFASYFIVSALADLPAYIVFPAVAAGTVMLITLIAGFIFKERIGILGVAGIALTFASVMALYPR